MAIAIDVANLGTAAPADGSTAAFNTSSAVASGGFIVLCVGGWNVTSLSSVSGGGLTWTIDKQGHAADPANPLVAIVSAQAPSGLASGTTITATYSASATAPSIGGMSFTGVATSSPVDGTPVGPTGVATAAWATASYSLTAGSVLIGTSWNEELAGSTPSAGTEAWDLDLSGSGQVVNYRIEGSAGSYTVGGTWSGAQKNTTIGVAYLAAAGGGGGGASGRDLMLMGMGT